MTGNLLGFFAGFNGHECAPLEQKSEPSILSHGEICIFSASIHLKQKRKSVGYDFE